MLSRIAGRSLGRMPRLLTKNVHLGLNNISKQNLRSFVTTFPILQQQIEQDILTIETSEQAEDNIPWYMREEESPAVDSLHLQTEIPEVPEDAPEALMKILEFVATKLGITDLTLFDLRNNTEYEGGATEIAKFMVIGTGKSGKHLQKASGELHYYIKHEMNNVPFTEGLVNNSVINRQMRRLRRKGKKPSAYTNNDFGAAANSWVMVDCKSDDIFVHLLTADRRADLDLESLWGPSGDNTRASTDSKRNDDIFSGVRYYHTLARKFSTRSSSVLSQLKEFDSKFDIYKANREEWNSRTQLLIKLHKEDPETYPFSDIQEHAAYMSACGYRMNFDEFVQYIVAILESPEIQQETEFEGRVFNRRYMYVREFIELYHPKIVSDDFQLSSNDIATVGEKLIPLLIASGSQMTEEGFITVAEANKPDAQRLYGTEELVEFNHNRIIPRLRHLLVEISATVPEFNSLQQAFDAIFLTIFSNEKSWYNFFVVSNDALNRGDLKMLQLSANLLRIKGSPEQCYKFLNDYVPYIMLQEKEFEAFKPAITEMINVCNPEGDSFRNIRESL